LAQQSIEQLLSQLPQEEPTDQPDEFGAAAPETAARAEGGFEWIITPEQFVDFWIASIFLLVGTWQVITIFFLVVG